MAFILAFDFGLGHIGVATGNTTTRTASAVSERLRHR